MSEQPRKEEHLVLKRTLVVLGIGLFFVVGLLPVFLLLAFADKLRGAPFIILFMLYLGALGAALTLLLRNRLLHQERAMLGDELFFEYYPREREREQRRLRRKGLTKE